jgi:flagellar basal body L-ring protein FlgH
VVKLDDALKASILQRYDLIAPPAEEPTEVKDKDSGDADPAAKAKAAAAAAAEKDKAKASESPKVVRAVIQEIRPRGMYEITGVEPVRFGNRTPVVSIEGTVRDRDIDSSDTISSESVLNLKLDVSAPPDPAKAAESTTAAEPAAAGG